MKKSFRIFFRDLKRLLTNRIALVVTAGVCALPSLYAWFNIYANMDPYSNTQGIKVAIANCDEGDENELLTLNAGDSIIDNLKKDHWIDDYKLLESLAQQNLNSGDKGAYALKQKWLQKGCEKQVIDEVLTQFDFSEVAIKVASKLLRKYQG